MDLPNTLMLLSRDPSLIAGRARGVFIRLTEGHVIQRVGVARPYRFSPGFGDIVAQDWIAGTVEQVRKQFGIDGEGAN